MQIAVGCRFSRGIKFVGADIAELLDEQIEKDKARVNDQHHDGARPDVRGSDQAGAWRPSLKESENSA